MSDHVFTLASMFFDQMTTYGCITDIQPWSLSLCLVYHFFCSGLRSLQPNQPRPLAAGGEVVSSCCSVILQSLGSFEENDTSGHANTAATAFISEVIV